VHQLEDQIHAQAYDLLVLRRTTERVVLNILNYQDATDSTRRRLTACFAFVDE
jgi:hypothetical protein